MSIVERIEKTPWRSATFALGACLTLSAFSLLSEGIGHLPLLIPGAAANFVVGAFASERIARVFLLIETCAVLVLLGYAAVQVHELFPGA